MRIHPQLQRQLDQCNLDSSFTSQFVEENRQFLDAVSEDYDRFDNERERLERLMEVSAREYQEKIAQIQALQITLVSSEKMAGIGQLSAGIAHEINNPLGFIKSNVDMLIKYIEKIEAFHHRNMEVIGEAPSRTHEALLGDLESLRQEYKKAKLQTIYDDLPVILEETTDGVQRISKIVRSLLNFSRKGSGIQSPGFDLNKGLHDTLTITHNEIKYDATIEESFQDLPLITANTDEINQVLLNILMNAIAAIRSRNIPGMIRLATYRDGNSVYCTISDNGGGIPKEVVPRIFEPFFTTKPVGSGTGLGLSISYDIIVNKHKGTITVETQEGEGTTFIISLPIEQAAALAD